MPRRIPDYPDAYAQWNYISSFGSIISVVSSIFFFYLVTQALQMTKSINTNQNNRALSLINIVESKLIRTKIVR
jgi:heme/copper-type cytochrome/quinol oxidase subunit 1